MKQTKPIFLQLGLSLCILLLACGVYYILVFRASGEFLGIYPLNLDIKSLLWLFLGFFGAFVIMWIFLTFAPRQKLYDKNVLDFARNTHLLFLIPFFFVNAFAEEILFRGALQYQLGIIVTSLVFTLVHFSYYKKPLMLLEVFMQGLLLGFLYEMSQSLWICTFCHAGFNWLLIYLIQKEYIVFNDQ